MLFVRIQFIDASDGIHYAPNAPMYGYRIKLINGIRRWVVLITLLTIACPFMAHSMTCHEVLSPETYSKETYLKYFLNQKREPEYQPSGVDWTYVQKLVEGYNNSKKTLSDLKSALAYFKSIKYEITIGKIVNGNTERVTGQIVDYQADRGWVEGKLFTVYTETGQLVEINFTDLDPKIFVVRKHSVPEWVSEEQKLSRLAARLGIESLTHTVAYHGSFDLRTIVQIFKDGHLGMPNSFQGGRVSNFFSLKGTGSEHSIGQIDFDIRLLDRKDYFFNNFHNYGRFTERSIRFDEINKMRNRLYYLSRSFKIQRARGQLQLIDGGEVVVWAHVPVTMIRKLHLTPEAIAWLVNKLDEENVKPPVGRTWGDIFFALPTPTK